MAYVAVADRAKIQHALRLFKAQFRNARRVERTLTSPGGTYTGKLWRLEAKRLWVAFVPSHARDGYHWISLGNEIGPSGKKMKIPVEINPPIRGTNRRLSGLIVQDKMGHYHLAHKGGLRGGKHNVTVDDFGRLYRGHGSELVQFPGDKHYPYFVLGRMGDKDLPGMLSRFAAEAQRIRDWKRAGGVTPIGADSQLRPDL